MKREDVLEAVAGAILGTPCSHPLRVGIDGVDAAGKTRFADDLVPYLHQGGRNVIRASIDGFHHPKEIRGRRGALSPDGYYLDSFDYPALIDLLLEPLGPQGTRRYRTAAFDFRTESRVELPVRTAGEDDLLIFEGVFLFRPEINHFWDVRIFLEVSFETNLARALERDGYLFGSREEIEKRYRAKYIPGQQIYLQTVKPHEKADFLIDNDDFLNPRILRTPNAIPGKED
jgi:uridine kinase